MNSRQDSIVPIHFGPPSETLYGVIHLPQAAPARECAIVICPSMGHEYIQFHRALRVLAEKLCDAGFPVLRFDYYGCGDSTGDSDQGTIPRWLTDISSAIAEVRSRSSRPKVGLFGYRLGGALAMMAAATDPEVHAVFLWDPVVAGKDYLRELEFMHQEMMHTSHVIPDPVGTDHASAERLGFPLSDSLISGLRGLDLTTIVRDPAARIFLACTRSDVRTEGLRRKLEITKNRTWLAPPAGPLPWRWEEDFAKTPVPYQAIQTLVQWASEAL
jgi:pimeloyl-ACP methyl ester carboxylesterase